MDKDRGRSQGILVQNPLLFDHIVERVISFVDLEYLPSIRLVSRQWERFALPKLLQNVHKIPVVIKGQGNTPGDSNSKIGRYLTYIAEGPRLIFHDFTLKNMALFSREPLVDIFISTCAAEITHLRLQFNEYQSPNTLIKWMDSLVNLKTLTLDIYSRLQGPDLQVLPVTPHVSWKSNLKRLCLNYNDIDIICDIAFMCNIQPLLRLCESLEELTLQARTNPWWTLQSVIRIFRIVPHYCPNALVEISVGKMSSEGLKYLMDQEQQNLKLKGLSCQSLLLWDGENKFSSFLEAHKNTLESVVVGGVKTQSLWAWSGVDLTELQFHCEHGPFDIIFPDVMPKLKVFQMGLPVPPPRQTRKINFAPVNFPVQLPSLEKLILYDGSAELAQSKDPDEWEYLSRFFEGSNPHLKLKELRLPFASSKLRKSVGAVSPEISSLTIVTRLDQNLQKIWEMWPQLKSLDLTLNGDRTNRVEDLIPVKKNKGTQGSSKDIDSDSGLLSIANLKDLKHFKLRMIGECKGSFIDFNVTRAFCKLPCLEFLLFNQHDITQRGTRQFLKHHPLLKKVVCPVHPEVYKIQREYLPNNFIPSEFSTEHSVAGCHCSFSK